MKILFVDTETTSLDPKTGRIVEIAASLYCSQENRLIRSLCFILSDDTIKITPEITAINGITQKAIDELGVDFRSVFPLLYNNFVEKSDYLCAHNVPFDCAFIEAENERFGFPKWEKPWIDTSVDLPYPFSITTRKLTHLAAEHGFLNPFPHTALADVLTAYAIFTEYELGDILKRQGSPTILIAAMVDYANRIKASGRGYRWNPSLKRWTKFIKTNELEAEKKLCNFDIELI